MGTCTGKHDSSSKYDKKIWLIVDTTPLPKDFIPNFQNSHQSPKGSFLSQQKAERLLYEFKRFVYLVTICYQDEQQKLKAQKRKLIRPSQIVPSPILDRMWRHLILSGSFYEQFCTRLFSQFHNRSTQMASNFDNYNLTLEMYGQHFGKEAPVAIWPKFEKNQEFGQSRASFVRIKMREFNRFQHQFLRKIKHKSLTDAPQLYKRVMKGIRNKVEQIRKKLKAKYAPKGDKAPVDQEEPFGQFARLSASALSMPDPGSSDYSSDDDGSRSGKVPRFFQRNLARSQCSKFDSLNRDSWYYSSDDQLAMTRDDSKRMFQSVTSATDFQEDILITNWSAYKEKYQEEFRNELIPMPVMRNFCKEMSASENLAKEVFNEYKRFHILSNLVRKDYCFLMSSMIRLMWECHMAETEEYRNFCYRAFDTVIFPPLRSNEILEYEKRDYQTTIDCYRKVFGKRGPHHIWLHSSQEFKREADHSYKYYNLRDFVYYRLTHQRAKEDQMVGSAGA